MQMIEIGNVKCKFIETCPLCNSSESSYVYKGVKDRIFGVEGEWNIKKCKNCGLLWLDPMPLESELSKLYENYYTHRTASTKNSKNIWYKLPYRFIQKCYLSYRYGYYENLKLVNLLGLLMHLHPGKREALDFSIMYLSSRDKGHLLDIGCGNGWLLKQMRELGWYVEGIDFDSKAVDAARKEKLNVRLGSLEEQKFPDNYFDAITMSHVIEHAYNSLKLLKECYRILKPGGRLVVVTPNSESFGYKLFKKAWLHLDPPRHLHIFCASSLCNLVHQAGFSKYKVSTTIRDANGLFMASRSIQTTGNYSWGTPYPPNIRIWARAMQLLEWGILKVKPNLGEEVLLIAEKQ